jgi:hypothetical protein
MEDLGIVLGFHLDEALKSALRGKETPEEREKALIDFIKKYEESANECIEDWKKRAFKWENCATEWKSRALARNVTIGVLSLVCVLALIGLAITIL